ncbi:unnamed protein product [Laminaria digitata]
MWRYRGPRPSGLRVIIQMGGSPQTVTPVDRGLLFQVVKFGWRYICVDAGCARKATDRRSVSDEVVMCTGACVSFFSRTQVSRACC